MLVFLPLQYAELLTALLLRYRKRSDASRQLDIPTIKGNHLLMGGKMAGSCPVLHVRDRWPPKA
jgi:hypothetical protein